MAWKVEGYPASSDTKKLTKVFALKGKEMEKFIDDLAERDDIRFVKVTHKKPPKALH